MSAPTTVLSALQGAVMVGLAGSRRPGDASVAACRALLEHLSPARSSVGDADGIDRQIRAALGPEALVMKAETREPRHLIARTMAHLRLVKRFAPKHIWVAFPDQRCPWHIGGPQQTWPPRPPAGTGPTVLRREVSGTWCGIAVARGWGIPTALYLPPGVALPGWWPAFDATEVPGWYTAFEGATWLS